MAKTKLKKNDEVRIITGKDKNKTGRILKVFPSEERVLIEGLNRVKRHRKPTRKDQHGGIKDEERAIHQSNVMFICPSCRKLTRIGLKYLENKEKVRFCKKCNLILDK